MGFLDRIFNRVNVGTISYASSERSEAAYITHNSTVLRDVSIVSKAVDIVASACMSTTPVCKSLDTVLTTTATKLLTKPNNEITGDELVYKIVEDLYLGGSSYVVLVGNVNSPAIEIHRIKPTKVSTFEDSNGVITSYKITLDRFSGDYILNTESQRYFNPSNDFVELLCIRHPSNRGILNSCRDEIDIIQNGLYKNSALLKNGGRLSMLLTFKDGLPMEEHAARMRSIEDVARRKSYGGFLGVSTGQHGVDVKEMGLSPKDMDYHQLQENCRREIYLRCGVPLPLVDNSASTMNNMSSANIQLYTLTVIPLCDLIYSKIGLLLSIREKKEYTTLTDQMLVPSIRDMLLTELERRKKVGVETINEMRALVGLDSVEGGDQIYIESRLITIGEQQNQLG